MHLPLVLIVESEPIALIDLNYFERAQLMREQNVHHAVINKLLEPALLS